MENGPYTGLPKFKRRRFSAVRDFPSGCGPFAPRIPLRAIDEAGCVQVAENLVGKESSIDVNANGVHGSHETDLPCQCSCMLKGLDSHVGFKVENSEFLSDQVDFPSGFAPGMPLRPNDDVCVKVIENLEVKERSIDVIGSGSLGLQETELHSRSLSMIQSFDPIMVNGKTNHVEFKVDNQEFSSDQVDRIASVDAEPMPQLDGLKPLNDEGVAEHVAALQNKATLLTNGMHKVDTTSLVAENIRQKYPPRRKISAVRDYPPFCGTNAPILSREKCAEVNIQENSDSQVSKFGRSVSPNSKQPDDGTEGREIEESKKNNSEIAPKICSNIVPFEKKLGKESLVYIGDKFSDGKLLDRPFCEDQQLGESIDNSELEKGRGIVIGLKSAEECPWRLGQKGNRSNSSGCYKGETKGRQNDFKLLQQPKPALKKMKGVELFKGKGTRITKNSLSKKIYGNMDHTGAQSREEDHIHGKRCDDLSLQIVGVDDPASLHNDLGSKTDGDDSNFARKKVKEALSFYRSVFNTLKGNEAVAKGQGSTRKRNDLQAAKILKEEGKYVNGGKQIVGSVPGVEVGDQFHYWVELNIVGLHRQSQGGIDFVKHDKKVIATSIVASGGYDNDTANSNTLIYMGSGGNMIGDKEPEDQKLERGNLGLKNSIDEKNPVRVIRGFPNPSDQKGRTYFYDGLYTVEEYWQEKGPHGKLVFKFKLVRIADQPELVAAKLLKQH